jgi:uncharacterized protein YjfI (DUF2170 family)|tara:strand:+ start:257 stop:697 length:441 start_codon:yes stop_codon:yes gene_type:complete
VVTVALDIIASIEKENCMSWDLESIESLFKEHDDFVVTREENCLLIANQDGIDAWLAISGEQILVETLLFASSEVKDKAALDHEILSTHMLFPLTTVGISTVGDEEYYVAFGALSAQSKSESIVIEVETLFQNVASFLDAYETHLS